MREIDRDKFNETCFVKKYLLAISIFCRPCLLHANVTPTDRPTARRWRPPEVKLCTGHRLSIMTRRQARELLITNTLISSASFLLFEAENEELFWQTTELVRAER